MTVTDFVVSIIFIILLLLTAYWVGYYVCELKHNEENEKMEESKKWTAISGLKSVRLVSVPEEKEE